MVQDTNTDTWPEAWNAVFPRWTSISSINHAAINGGISRRPYEVAFSFLIGYAGGFDESQDGMIPSSMSLLGRKL